jgi:methylthioxylose transferase
VKIWLAIVLGSIASMSVLWMTSIPLGIPGEWTWERAPIEPDTGWNLCGGVVAAGLLIAFVMQGRHRFERLGLNPRHTLEIASWLAGLVIVNFAWIWIVQELGPVQNRLGKAALVLYYPSSSGYYSRARFDEPQSSRLLAGYENLMREGDVLHTGTHPPGLILLFQWLIPLCDTPSPLTTMLDLTQPASFREGCDVIATNSIRGKIRSLLLPTDRRVLWLATLLDMVSASLTVIPLFGLLSRHTTRANAWVSAALWSAVPAVTVFVPKSDAAFPFMATTLMWLWLTAWDRRSLLLALLAGLATWCGLMCSLAFLPIVLAAGIFTLGTCLLLRYFLRAIKPTLNESLVLESAIGFKRGLCIVAAAAGIAIPTWLLWFFLNVNMLNVWLWNYRNHGQFYAQYPRTYWKWLLVNPLELSFAAGWPLMLLAIIACVNAFRAGVTQESMKVQKCIGVILVVWGLLWITGKNSGEAARLWILFLPWLVWIASFQLESMEKALSTTAMRRRQTILLLSVQLLVCLLTVIRVSGFHFEAS